MFFIFQKEQRKEEMEKRNNLILNEFKDFFGCLSG